MDLFSDRAESVEVADHGVYRGKEGVRRFYIDLLQGGEGKEPRFGLLSINFQLQGVITVDPGGETAKGRWYGFMVEAKPTLSLHEGELRALWGNGIYENEYVKENGKWLFSKLHWNNTLCSPFDAGWLKLPLMGWMPIPDADEPPTCFHPYPARYKVPYTFKHPITGEE